MTRTEGWRAIRFVGRFRPLLVLLGLLLPANGSAMTIGGRIGFEVDGLGEDYKSYGVLDERVNLGDDVQEQLENPVRSREARTLALLELRLATTGDQDSWFRLTEIGRLGTRRHRNSLVAEAGFRAGANRLRIENEWSTQGGEEEPTGGSQDYLTMTWDRYSLPWGFRSQIRGSAEWSVSTEEAFAAVFDYRSLRGQMQLRRDVTSRLEIRSLIGYRPKTAWQSSSGSYDCWFGETEVSGSLLSRDRLRFLIGIAERSYADDTAGIPSSRSVNADGRYEYRATEAWRPYTEQQFEWQDYDSSSEVFQDHHSWTGEFGTDFHMKSPDDDLSAIALGLATEVRLRTAGKVELYRPMRSPGDSLSFVPTYDSFGGLAGISRNAGSSFWGDLSLEVGRREYSKDGETTNLAFDGLNFSFSTSDYTYFRATLLAEWTPVSWLRAEGFVQWDDELHDQSSDDFRLWIVSASLTYPF